VSGPQTKEELIKLIRGLVSLRHRHGLLPGEKRKIEAEMHEIIDQLSDEKVFQFIERHPEAMLEPQTFVPRNESEARAAVSKGKKIVNALTIHTRESKKALEKARKNNCSSVEEKNRTHMKFREKLINARARLAERQNQLISFEKRKVK